MHFYFLIAVLAFIFPIHGAFGEEYGSVLIITAVGVEAEDNPDPQKDVIARSNNPDVAFLLRKGSPHFKPCEVCANKYVACFKKVEDPAIESLFNECQDTWQACVIDSKSSCRMLKKNE